MLNLPGLAIAVKALILHIRDRSVHARDQLRTGTRGFDEMGSASYLRHPGSADPVAAGQDGIRASHG